MNVTEFAEQVVFGTTLEDKLLVPGKLTDDVRSAPNVDSVVTPGRPVGLQMLHGTGGNVQPPSDDNLESELARGQLLHFLANHELLATELMALVLLKFPDAPPAFRKGILATLREEQQHTQMYIRRMKECGVEFGSFPLSGQFWRIIEPMKSPMDFVSRLSLTFEQANLDYSLHFAGVFRNLGDTQTADLLHQIYQDEIGHVQHGLHWFRKWKNPEQSDWEAYQASLDFPMSPQRALGPRGAFNREGRLQAGLTGEFIDAIEVYRLSRGRAPTVRWFDPAAEAELAADISPREVQLMDQLGKDLELVMVPMARQDDVVLVRRMPSQQLRKQLIDAGFDLPQFVPFDEIDSLVHRKLHNFSPWAWTPKNHEVVQPLVASSHVSPANWQNDMCDLYRKSWGAIRLSEWLIESGRIGEIPNWFTKQDCAGIPVDNLNDLQVALSNLAQRGYETAIFKRDLATSGRRQRRLSCSVPLSVHDLAWLNSIFASGVQQQPLGIVEPELERLADFSFLWHMPLGSPTPRFLGWTRGLVTDGRRYIGTRLGTALDECDQRLKRFVLADRCASLQIVADWLEPRIASELTARNFTGYFGVDSMVCRDHDGEFRIKPLVELNPRTTMGHVALKLAKRLAPGAEAEFRILTKTVWDELQEQLKRVPSSATRDGRWKTGVILLGEVDGNTKLIPVVIVGKQAIEILGKTGQCDDYS